MDLESMNFSELRDTEIVAIMRKCHKGKFETLLRMHLSFELDLNADEFNLPCHEIVYEDKGKVKKWSGINKKYKHGATGVTSSSTNPKTCSIYSNGIYSSPQEIFNQKIDAGFLFHLPELKEFLMLDKNISVEGIFRKPGSIPRQNELKQRMQKDKPLNLLESDYSVHDCANVFKRFLADLSEPLLTDAHYPAHLQIAPLCLCVNAIMETKESVNAKISRKLDLEKQKKELHLLNAIQLLLLDLPEENRQLLQHVIDVLYAVAKWQEINRMGPDSLAIMFTPHLICPRNLPPEALPYLVKKMSSIISYMIVKGQEIFAIPPKLATDIRAYFLECKRKKNMSPDVPLDESLLDALTVNTVYTFVDREKTAAAHCTNTTETELAQLYAHIQTLPESARKRKLIKQFNKQNGQGTPLSLQMQEMSRVRNADAARSSKSLSDSIKKHIFHRGVMRKSPKRQPHLAMEAHTPITNDLKKQKQQRALFQSPNPHLMPTYTATATAIKRYNTKTRQLQNSIVLSTMSDSTTFPLSCITSLNFPESKCDSVPVKGKSASAPVSRQISNEASIELNTSLNALPSQYSSTDAIRKCNTFSKLRTDTKINEKAVVLEDLDQLSKLSTPVQLNINRNDLKSLYKSEPNLSVCDVRTTKGLVLPNIRHPISKLMPGKYITRKLRKGVSMGNLKFPFTAPESTKRLVHTVSSSLKGRSSYEDDDSKSCPDIASNSFATEPKTPTLLINDTDNVDNAANTFDNKISDSEESNDDIDQNCSTEINSIDENCTKYNVSFTGGRTTCNYLLRQQTNRCHSIDLITSTPSLLSGRRSMSPITKSTQRMPKAMQESIMTPRSRKPVMALTTNNNTGNFNELNQNDENGDLITRNKFNLKQDGQSSIILKELSIGNYDKDIKKDSNSANTLSTNFKEYLLKRSVFANSPEDASFSSHSDDFCSSQEIEDLEENQLSNSLLYCLDGNKPTENDELNITSTTTYKRNFSDATSSNIVNRRPHIITNRLATNPFVLLNNARKRAASGNYDINTPTTLLNENQLQCIRTEMEMEMNKDKNAKCILLEANFNSASSSNKENINQDYQLSKIFLLSEYPGETSF